MSIRSTSTDADASCARDNLRPCRTESSRPIAGPMFVENLKSRLRFFRKHRGPVVVLFAGILLAVSVLLRHAARETQAAALRFVGRAPEESLLLRLVIFRAARHWVMRGLPLSAPETAGEKGR